MSRKIKLADLPRVLEARIAALRPAVSAALGVGGEAAVRIAAEKIGHYQPDVPPAFPAWAPLAASTVADKERQGYAPPDKPLLRTGEMRASLSHYVAGLTLHVGSTDRVALYQELGTSRLPPRPFIAPALAEAMPTINKAVGAALVKALGGEAREAAPMKEAAE